MPWADAQELPDTNDRHRVIVPCMIRRLIQVSGEMPKEPVRFVLATRQCRKNPGEKGRLTGACFTCGHSDPDRFTGIVANADERVGYNIYVSNETRMFQIQHSVI